jgi:hypothetical protein
MIETLESKFGRIAAAGVLARAALSVGYADAPGGAHEQRLLMDIIEEARRRLGLSLDDTTLDAFERISDFLDSESDRLSRPIDTTSALSRLAERGDLPSDLYEISVVKNISDALGSDFALEKQLIEATVRAPTAEQHYGPSRRQNEPTMISLFVRSFRTKWPLRDFIMLVGGLRDGFKLSVQQAWRIYPTRVDLAGAYTPIEMLQRFANEYGAEIEVGNKKGHFFLFAERPPDGFKYEAPSDKPTEVMVSHFTQQRGGIPFAAMLVAVDLDKYRKTLDALGVKREFILDEFPKPRRANL